MKIIVLTILSVFLILLFSTVWNFDNKDAFDTIATFLSITIGFTITALSIIATSSFSKHLYSLEDDKDNSRTLLHILISEFKISTVIFICTIGLILIFQFFTISNNVLFYAKSYPISFNVLLKSIIGYMTIVSFIYFFRLFDKFSKFVLQSAKNNKEKS